MNPTYVLECPACAARFDLKKHDPNRRVRCRKCRAFMRVPPLPGQEEPKPEVKSAESPPEALRKLGESPAVRRWLAISCALLVAIAGGTYLLIRRIRSHAAKSEERRVEGPMSLSKLLQENTRSAFPLAAGYEWEYASPTQTESRRVLESSSGPTNEPQFEVGVAHPRGSCRQVIRYSNDGPLLVDETWTSGGKRVYSPPMLLVPRPLYADSVWSYSGDASKDGVGEAWNLEFRGTGLETLTTPLGTWQCFRVQASGTRGSDAVDETTWYAIGIGMVKLRRKLPDGSIEEATLQKCVRPGG